MNDVELLSDDHTLLNSQVMHVMTLLKVLADGHFESVALHSELIQQVDLLGDQLIEHFEFEESTAFPQLEKRFAQFSTQLQSFLAEHILVLRAFEAFRAELKLEISQSGSIDVLTNAAHFESSFKRHATSETQLFDELARQLGRLR